jgi:hypothetical protein
MAASTEVGKPVSAVLQSRDPGAPPFAYVKGDAVRTWPSTTLTLFAG